MSRPPIIRTLTLSCAVFLALAALPSSAYAQKTGVNRTAASEQEKSAQKDRDLEHELVQSDGVNHPRDTSKGGKIAPKAVFAAKKVQRDLNLEHDMVQGDGVNHPRQRVTDRKVDPSAKAGVAAKKTQRSLDLEHDMVQGEGVNHPRETIKK